MPRPEPHELWASLHSRDPEPVALLLLSFELLWGTWVATDWGTTVTLYGGIDGDIMGFCMAGTGLLMLVAMLWNRHRLYTLSLVLGFAGWTYIAASSIASTGGRSVGTIVYGLLALWTAWVWVRLRWDDARLEDLPSDDDREEGRPWTGYLRLW